MFKCTSFIYIEDWLSDGYRWKQNGVVLLPSKEPSFKKIHYYLRTPNGLTGDFKKIVFRQFGQQEISRAVVVQYVGNETLAINFPHSKYKRYLFLY